MDHVLSSKVSIGLPVYNGSNFLPQALDSLLAQDYERLEIVVSDNGSEDDTADICTDYARRDSRIVYHRFATNVGAAKNYNKTFELSTGAFFKWATHDDLIRPTFVRRCLEVFAEQRDQQVFPSIVYPTSDFIDDQGHIIGRDKDRMHTLSRSPAIRAFRALQSMNMAAPVFGLMPREVMLKTRLIGSFVASDYVFMVEAAMLGPIVQFEDRLFLRRIHPQMSRKANTTKGDVLNWFDPNARSRLSMRQRLYLEYVRSAWNCKDLGFLGRLACTGAVVSGVGIRRAHVTAGRWKQKILSDRTRQPEVT